MASGYLAFTSRYWRIIGVGAGATSSSGGPGAAAPFAGTLSGGARGVAIGFEEERPTVPRNLSPGTDAGPAARSDRFSDRRARTSSPRALRAEREHVLPHRPERRLVESRARAQQVVGVVPARGALDRLDEPVVADDVAVVAGDEARLGAVRPQHRRRVDDAVVVPDLDLPAGRAAELGRLEDARRRRSPQRAAGARAVCAEVDRVDARAHAGGEPHEREGQRLQDLPGRNGVALREIVRAGAERGVRPRADAAARPHAPLLLALPVRSVGGARARRGRRRGEVVDRAEVGGDVPEQI